jgi:hypothetical protein
MAADGYAKPLQLILKGGNKDHMSNISSALVIPDSLLAKEATHLLREHSTERNTTMSFVTRKDRSQLYYKEWGQVTSITLSHGWPLNLEQRK